MARISPVRGSITMTVPPRAPCSLTACSSAACAWNWRSRSIVVTTEAPAPRARPPSPPPAHPAPQRLASKTEPVRPLPRQARQDILVPELEPGEADAVGAHEPQHLGRE